MTIRSAWFCPACQKHHAPHVETCPGPVDAIGTTPMPITPLTVPYSPAWYPEWMKRASATKPCDCKGICMNAACPNRLIVTSTAAGAVQ